MGAFALYPWIAGPLVASEDFVQAAKHLPSMGTLTAFLVEGAHHYGLPVLVVVPGTLLIACVVIARHLTKRAQM
ncbi:MAG: hypothetical protein ABSC00_09255 [Acidimicrobiales bacterium]